MTFFFVRHKREAVAEFSFCNGPFLCLLGEETSDRQGDYGNENGKAKPIH